MPRLSARIHSLSLCLLGTESLTDGEIELMLAVDGRLTAETLHQGTQRNPHGYVRLQLVFTPSGSEYAR